MKYPWPLYKNEDIKRQFKQLSVLGADVLPEEKLKKVITITVKIFVKIIVI